MVTHQLTHDPAMNPVMVLATFDVIQFLAKNVGIVAKCADTLPTFPTLGLMAQKVKCPEN